MTTLPVNVPTVNVDASAVHELSLMLTILPLFGPAGSGATDVGVTL
jgi:hypothetical protein